MCEIMEELDKEIEKGEVLFDESDSMELKEMRKNEKKGDIQFLILFICAWIFVRWVITDFYSNLWYEPLTIYFDIMIISICLFVTIFFILTYKSFTDLIIYQNGISILHRHSNKKSRFISFFNVKEIKYRSYDINKRPLIKFDLEGNIFHARLGSSISNVDKFLDIIKIICSERNIKLIEEKN